MNHPPFLFRLMLSTLFLPVVILFGILWHLFLVELPDVPFFAVRSITLGVPTVWWFFAALILPFVLWLWILWSGNWRRPVLTAAVLYFSAYIVVVFELDKPYIPSEQCMIELNGSNGTDVYCNGVLLGTIEKRKTLRISVAELKTKVPEWTTPPEQRWYDNTDPSRMIYTWLPWDDFIEERFAASREQKNNQEASTTPRAIKARQEAINKHDAGCRYWWHYQDGAASRVVSRESNPSYLNFPFDEHVFFQPSGNFFSRSDGFHVQLLVDVLPELTTEQKVTWDQHVLNHENIHFSLWDVLRQTANSYRRWDKDDPRVKLYETALHSTARLKYGLSDPPTEEEYRRLLAEDVKESIDNSRFVFEMDYYVPSEVMLGVGGGEPFGLHAQAFPVNIHETIQKPLVEQWRKNKYRWDYGWAPIAHYSGKDKSKEYFTDFVQYTATTNNALFTLLANESPYTAALFKTLLNRRALWECLTRKINLYPSRIEAFARVNNPLLEGEYRNYIHEALSDPDHDESTRNNVNRAVFEAIMAHINREEIDRAEFSSWIASLSLPAPVKNHALRMLRIRQLDTQTFADRLQQAAGWNVQIETELTLDDVEQWFADNPKGDLDQFIAAQEENIVIATVTGLFDQRRNTAYSHMEQQEENGPHLWFVLALLRSDTVKGEPQVRELIRQIAYRSPSLFAQAIETEYLAQNRRGDDVVGSNNLPEYILDLFSEQNMYPMEVIASVLAICDSPKAGAILEKWSGEITGKEKRQVERFDKMWRTRHAMRQKKMDVFLDLAAGKMSPDDLLMPQPAWVWKDGKYVQE